MPILAVDHVETMDAELMNADRAGDSVRSKENRFRDVDLASAVEADTAVWHVDVVNVVVVGRREEAA